MVIARICPCLSVCIRELQARQLYLFKSTVTLYSCYYSDEIGRGGMVRRISDVTLIQSSQHPAPKRKLLSHETIILKTIMLRAVSNTIYLRLIACMPFGSAHSPYCSTFSIENFWIIGQY